MTACHCIICVAYIPTRILRHKAFKTPNIEHLSLIFRPADPCVYIVHCTTTCHRQLIGSRRCCGRAHFDWDDVDFVQRHWHQFHQFPFKISLQNSQLSELVERWRLLTATERDNLNLTEGQASLVARMAKSRKKRQQKLRKTAKFANEREQVSEYYEMLRERVLDGSSSQTLQSGTGTQGNKKFPFPTPKKGKSLQYQVQTCRGAARHHPS